MPSKLTNKRWRFTRQGSDLMTAAPQVIAARMVRMATAGLSPSARDRREFATMGTEKLWAVAESRLGMTAGAVRFQQAVAAECWKAAFRPWHPTSALSAWTGAARRLESAALDTVNDGLAPVRRRAVANARRLRRRPAARR